MSLAVSYSTHTVEITASGLAVAAIGNSVEVSAYNHVVQVSPLVYQVSVAQAGVPGPTGPGVPLGGTTGQVMVKLSDADLDTGWGSVGGGDMMKSTYDTDGDGKVDAAEVADGVPWSGVTDKPTIPANLEDLADVNASSPSDGQVLTWDTGTSKWVPETPSGAVGDELTLGNYKLSFNETEDSLDVLYIGT